LDPKEGDTNNGTPQTYSLTLRGEGMSVDRKIDERTALEVINLVMAGASQRPRQERGEGTFRSGAQSSKAPGGGAEQSLREYLDEVSPKRNPDKILAVAKYTTRDKNENRFSPDDVKARFPHAAEKVPGNFNRDFRWTVQNGWIARLPGTTDEFYVTGKGDNALEEKFSIEVRRETGVGKGSRGGRRKSARKTNQT
jgi:hypothetical protein